MAEQIDPVEDLARMACGRGIAELRAAYERSLALGRATLASAETLSALGLLGLREIGHRLGQHVVVNTRAIFDLADAQARAWNLSDLCELQGRFLGELSDRLAGQWEDLEQLVSAQMAAFRDEVARDTQA